MNDDQTLESGINFHDVLSRADVLIDEQQLSDGYDRMAEQITAEMADLDPVVVSIMKGGMMPTVEITKRLSFPLEIDYLHATRYLGETQGGELVWKVSPGVNLADRHVLVVDDILDEGKTLEIVLNAIDAQGAATIRTAMLLQKMHDRCQTDIRPDFLGFEVEDRYVFGAGLDFKDYFRQLPAVYAAAPEDI